MRPRIRPSSTRRSTPSNATVVPKALRKPRASMQAMASSLLLFRFRFRLREFRWRVIRRRLAVGIVQQFCRREAEPLNSCMDPGPFFAEKLLPFTLQQQIARPGVDEHAETSPALDQLLVHQLLITFQNRERI